MLLLGFIISSLLDTGMIWEVELRPNCLKPIPCFCWFYNAVVAEVGLLAPFTSDLLPLLNTLFDLFGPSYRLGTDELPFMCDVFGLFWAMTT